MGGLFHAEKTVSKAEIEEKSSIYERIDLGDVTPHNINLLKKVNHVVSLSCITINSTKTFWRLENWLNWLIITMLSLVPFAAEYIIQLLKKANQAKRSCTS